ncbi:MAG: alanine racemase [Desulfovibrio sp.]|jgi:alanine racemase|nr:alanine racemase [Desulfovibrio sp.]
MPDPQDPILADIFLSNIRSNYALLQDKARGSRPGGQAALPLPQGDLDFFWPDLMPVVKADAYGHGHIEAGRELMRAGADCFASGNVREAVELRLGLAGAGGEKNFPPILSLLGLTGPDDLGLCVRHGIIPLIYNARQLEILKTLPSLSGKLAVGVKCNTGMARLGFDAEDIPHLREALRQIPGVRPLLALSHLHSADSDTGPENTRLQAKKFAAVLSALRVEWPRLAASLANSAGTLMAHEIGKLIGPHICRPGIALYGCNPFAGTDLENKGRGLRPAMAVSAPLISERRIRAGESLGYGLSFTAVQDTRVGIMTAGYADGFSRGLSNKGEVCVCGKRAPVVGRVSMQMSAVDISALPDDAGWPLRAWLIGGPYAQAVSGEETASAWGSIVYEVLCLLGRNRRVHHP